MFASCLHVLDTLMSVAVSKSVCQRFVDVSFNLSFCGWSKAFATVKMNLPVFWVITRRKVVWYRRFGTTYRSYLQGSNCQASSWTSRFQAVAVVWMINSVFWGVIIRRVVFIRRRFGPPVGCIFWVDENSYRPRRCNQQVFRNVGL
jgi:hypothetical protein